MIVILMLFFNVRWRLLPLAVVIIGVIWAFGLAGYMGIPLTLVTIAGLPVMLGIGIDYAIQMHSRIEEEVIIDRSPHPIQAAARGLGPALLVVTFDAVFAFAAIQISQVPMIREFGWLLTVGIIAICVSSIINPLAALGIREYRSPTKGRDFSEGALGRMVVKLGSLPASSALILAVLSVAVFVAGSVLEPKLKLETDPINWVNQDTQVIKDLRHIEEQVGGSSELGVFVQSDDAASLYTDEVVDLRRRVHPRPDRPVRQGAVGGVEHRRHGVGPDRHPRCRARATRGGRRRGRLGPGARGHQAVDRATGRRGAQRGVPDQADLARGTGGRRRRRARDRVTRRNQHHAVGSGGGGRGPAREPRGQPGRADLAGRRPGVPVPRGAAPLDHQGVAVDGAGAHRLRARHDRDLPARHRAQPDDRGRRPARGRDLHRVHLADPAALPRGAAPRARTAGGDRRHRGAARAGPSSCRR
ncbi:MAG: MMPL family transporter [Microthrixaceae bacterium]